MIKCLENHKHLIFLRQEQLLLSKFLLNSKVKIRVLQWRPGFIPVRELIYSS
jgi:hypothetical protein